MGNKVLAIWCLFAALAYAQTAEPADASGFEFFEGKVRPVLAKNCYGCHSAATKVISAGLQLDTREGLRKGGVSGPAIIPGRSSKSLLIRALHYQSKKMPPSGQLPEAVIADFEHWVDIGAPDPREGKTPEWKPVPLDLTKARSSWTFQPPRKPSIPALRNEQWPLQTMDRFVLSKLEEKKLMPAVDADRATWLRRVSFDLTGLPPAPAEIDAFLKDRTADAYAKVVDRLLASEQFGERWGRHWLDVARYAESVGRSRNYTFPYAWRYRDYVIDSFNKDKPYDTFVREQIAGDLLPASSDEQRNEQTIGTGFLAIGSHDLLEVNPAMFQMDMVDEQIGAISRVFLGLTVSCARCHDHKFDPISTTDYYGMAGIFVSTKLLSGLWNRPGDNTSYFDVNLLQKLSYAPGKRPLHLTDPAQIQKWNELQAKISDMQHGFRPDGSKKPEATFTLRTKFAKPIQEEMDKLPLPLDLAMAVSDADKIRDCEVHIAGEVTQLGPKIPRGLIEVLSRPGEKIGIGPGESGRLQLAEWLSRRDNALTARVMVNRVWSELFGRGIVATPDNFGAVGEKPTHPELLDYLAVRFMDQGWSVKKIIREIALSRTYRMAAAPNPSATLADPDNKLLWRANVRRLEVEAIRDALLFVSGDLDLQRASPSPVFGFRRGYDVGRGIGTPVGDFASSMKARSVYLPVVRNFLPPMYETFDFPEPSEPKGSREATTVATQALFIMNSKFVMERCRRAAERLLEHAPVSDELRIAQIFRQTVAREPSPEELAWSLGFVRKAAAKSATADAWARLYQAMFATAEFRYRS